MSNADITRRTMDRLRRFTEQLESGGVRQFREHRVVVAERATILTREADSDDWGAKTVDAPS